MSCLPKGRLMNRRVRRELMTTYPALSKIQLDHLDRDALIYVRQSSLMQVRDNTASTMRQYDLVQRALSLGWTREHIHVIDQDQALWLLDHWAGWVSVAGG